MSNLGVGVMIGMLSGNAESVAESVAAYEKAQGKQIDRVEITGLDMEDFTNALVLYFVDGTALQFADGGQSCCESRYMVCDDDLSAFAGATFTGAELMDGPEPAGRDDVHEVQFLHVATSRGKFTVSNHNEHNGYYGGFCIRCSYKDADAPK